MMATEELGDQAGDVRDADLVATNRGTAIFAGPDGRMAEIDWRLEVEGEEQDEPGWSRQRTGFGIFIKLRPRFSR